MTTTPTRRQEDAERLYGPLYPYPLRKDTKPRAVWPQGGRMSLYADIRNIEVPGDVGTWSPAYLQGFRDACNAAAELALPVDVQIAELAAAIKALLAESLTDSTPHRKAGRLLVQRIERWAA